MTCLYPSMLSIMNVVLESPLEAQALNYISFGIFTAVNNLWTWIAVITAAVSYWRIRSTGGESSPKPNVQPCTESNPDTTDSQPQIQTANVCSPSACDFGETKGGKITLYYDMEEERESDGQITAVRGRGVDGCEEWWERLMRVRVVDMEWRRYQDLTVINGNVVRFWDECGIIRDDRYRYSSSFVGVW